MTRRIAVLLVAAFLLAFTGGALLRIATTQPPQRPPATLVTPTPRNTDLDWFRSLPTPSRGTCQNLDRELREKFCRN